VNEHIFCEIQIDGRKFLRPRFGMGKNNEENFCLYMITKCNDRPKPGTLFYLTTTVCHFPPLLPCTCGQSSTQVKIHLNLLGLAAMSGCFNRLTFHRSAGTASRCSDSLCAVQSGNQILVETRLSAPIQTGPGAHPASYTMGTGSFRGVKRPRRGVAYPPTSSAEVK